jgi:hypothetical protein
MKDTKKEVKKEELTTEELEGASGGLLPEKINPPTYVFTPADKGPGRFDDSAIMSKAIKAKGTK